VLPVAVADDEADWASQRFPQAHSGGDFDLVPLDLHAPAAPVTRLAALQLQIDQVHIDPETCGQALQDAGQALAVRFPCGNESHHR